MGPLAARRRARGEVNPADAAVFAALAEAELLVLLRSQLPVERSCAAIHLRKYQNPLMVEALCHQLEIERKLYTKIALCETLAASSPLSIAPLISRLGRIGDNQEIAIPEKGFYKVSYPLPRDIAARTLCRIGAAALPQLADFIASSEDKPALAQALDAYGHIIYSNRMLGSSLVLQGLQARYAQDDFLNYKLTRCLSGIHDVWSRTFLLKTLKLACAGLRLEALRSWLLLGLEIPPEIQSDFSPEMKKLAIFLKKKRTL